MFLLQRNKYNITQRVGCEVRVKRVCDKVASRAVKAGVEKRIITTDPADIINDPEIDIDYCCSADCHCKE